MLQLLLPKSMYASQLLSVILPLLGRMGSDRSYIWP